MEDKRNGGDLDSVFFIPYKAKINWETRTEIYFSAINKIYTKQIWGTFSDFFDVKKNFSQMG
jgi:hypothetical protein